NAFTASSNSTSVTVDFTVPVAASFTVNSTSPAAGSVVVGATPSQYVVNLSGAVDPTTVQPSDFLVNGRPATGAVLTNSNQTITSPFTSDPVTTQGVQSMHIDAGAFTRASDGNAVVQFDGTFRFNATLLQVISTSPPVGSVFTISSSTTFDVTFNEPVDPTSVQAADLALSGIAGATVSGVTVLPGNTTARFTITGLAAEGTLGGSIAAGAVNDVFGNPGSSFSANYPVDIGTVPYPVPLTSERPAGSLIYDPTASGAISFAGDTDAFTLAVDPGQTITVVVTPTATGLQPTVQLTGPLGPLGTASAPAAGQKVALQTLPAAVGGTYTVTVGSVAGTTGGYTVQIILNAFAETEGTAATNNTPATAQSLGSSFINLQSPAGTASRGAVVGQTTVTSTPGVNLITNGTFETGNFNGWTVSSQGQNR